MSKINGVAKIYEFTNDGNTYGCYIVMFNGATKLFVRNGDSIGVVTHPYNEPATKCVGVVRDDVAEEFLAML